MALAKLKEDAKITWLRTVLQHSKKRVHADHRRQETFWFVSIRFRLFPSAIRHFSYLGEARLHLRPQFGGCRSGGVAFCRKRRAGKAVNMKIYRLIEIKGWEGGRGNRSYLNKYRKGEASIEQKYFLQCSRGPFTRIPRDHSRWTERREYLFDPLVCRLPSHHFKTKKFYRKRCKLYQGAVMTTVKILKKYTGCFKFASRFKIHIFITLFEDSTRSFFLFESGDVTILFDNKHTRFGFVKVQKRVH
jgi:hypothetical protein